jgi:hypothetical protein
LLLALIPRVASTCPLPQPSLSHGVSGFLSASACQPSQFSSVDAQLVEQLMNPGQAWVVASSHSNVDAQDYNTGGASECAELPNAAHRDELCREFTR